MTSIDRSNILHAGKYEIIDKEFYPDSGDDQETHYRGVLTTDLYGSSAEDYMLLRATLSGAGISLKEGLIHDHHDRRGYYIEKVNVKLYWDQMPSEVGVSDLASRDEPKKSMETNTVSISFGINAASVPSAGGSMSYSETESVTITQRILISSRWILKEVIVGLYSNFR